MSDPKRVVKLAKMFQDVLDVAKDLERFSDLEQATRNARMATVKEQDVLEGTRTELAKTMVDFLEVKDDLKVAKKEAEDTLDLARQAGQEIISEAKEEAEVVIKLALGQEQVVADRIVEDQERHAAKMKVYLEDELAAQASVHVIEEELAGLRERIGH